MAIFIIVQDFVAGRRLLSFTVGLKQTFYGVDEAFLDLERFVRVYDVGESFVIAP